MKFSVVFCAALAALAEAKANFTNSAADFATIMANTPFTLKWSGGTPPYTIVLQSGDPSNLKDVATLAQGLTGESFTWTPEGNMASGIYNFKITDGSGDPNYSVRWNFQSTGSSTTGASSTNSGSSSTTAGSSSSVASSGSSSSTSGSSSSTATRSSSTTGSQSATSASSTASRTTATTATTTPTSTPANTNNAMSAKSPLALILVTIAALLYFN